MHDLTSDEVAAALAPPPTALLVELCEGDRAAALALLAAGADPNAADTRQIIGHGATPLHFAAVADDLELVRTLIAAGADVNARSLAGHTPLWLACNAGCTESARELLVAGADPNIRCNEGYNPLGRVYQSELVLAALLRSYGAVV